MWGNEKDFSILLGKTLSKIDGSVGDEEMVFTTVVEIQI